MKAPVYVSDGKGNDYLMKFGAAAMAEYEAKFDCPVTDIENQFAELEDGKLKMTDMIELMRILLRQPGTESGREVTCDVIDHMGLLEMGRKIGDVITAAFPKDSSDDGAAGPVGNGGRTKKTKPPAPKK